MRYPRAASLALLSLLTAFAATANGQKVYCHKDLKKAHELIDDRWSFKLFKPGWVDLDAAYRELEPRAKRAKTPEACAEVLELFMARLGDGHSRLHHYPGVERSTPYLALRSLRERLSRTPGQQPKVHLYVISRDTTDAILEPIRPGSEIISVDGAPVDSLYRSMSQRMAGSTSQWRDYRCDRELLVGPPESELTLEYREPGGDRKTVTIRRPPADEDIFHDKDFDTELYTYLGEVTTSRWKRLDEGWGYIKFTSFSHGGYRHTIERFDEAVDSLLDTPGLIIDLRGNGGGYVDAVGEFAGRFVEHRQTIAYFNVREPGQNVIMTVYDPVSGGASDRVQLLAKPRGKIYGGPVVILIDRRCFSACEMFTGGMQAIGRALVIGTEATGGGSGFVGGLELPSGARISFSWTVAWLPNGQQVEGQGVSPDIRMRERPRDWAEARDRVLERGIKALEQGEASALVDRKGP